jgi:hypothetical protein
LDFELGGPGSATQIIPQSSLSAAEQPVKIVSQGWLDFNGLDSSGERVLLGFGIFGIFGRLGFDIGRAGPAPKKTH